MFNWRRFDIYADAVCRIESDYFLFLSIMLHENIPEVGHVNKDLNVTGKTAPIKRDTRPPKFYNRTHIYSPGKASPCNHNEHFLTPSTKSHTAYD